MKCRNVKILIKFILSKIKKSLSQKERIFYDAALVIFEISKILRGCLKKTAPFF